MKEVYAEQIVDRSAAARQKLAEALLFQADKSASTPVDQFVLLAAAIDAGVDAGNLPLAFKAADRMAEAYEVDVLALKADTLGKINAKSVLPESAGANVESGLGLISQLMAVDDYAAGARLCATIQTLTGGDADLRAHVLQKQREVGAARDAHERVARDMKKLEALPEDPAANLAVGKYFCFVKGDWARGLPMLGKGSDAAIKALAAQELAGLAADDAIIRVADGWWDTAGKQDVVSRAGIMNHAAGLYSQAVKQIDGLRRVQIEKRIAEAAKGPVSAAAKSGGKHVVDLLKLIDPKRDGVNGDWELGPTGLTSGNQREARLGIPYDPPDEYDYHFAFTRNENKELVQAMVSRNGHTVSMVFWGDNKINYGMENWDDKPRWANPTTGKVKVPFKNGQRYDCVIQVRTDSVTVFLDRRQLFSLKTDFSNLKDGGQWEIRGAKLGVGSHENSATFNAVELLEVTGSGKSTVPARR